MTVPVPDQLEYISDADGVTKDFSYPKRFLQKDEIVVLLRDADGVDTPQILNTHYTIAGSSWPSGGTISFINAPQAPNKVVLYRMTQAKQTVDLENNQRNDAPSVERQLDRLTMAIQDRGRLGDAAWWGLLAEVAARVHGDKLLNDRVDQEIIDRIDGDEALASLIGNVGSGNAPLFDTRLAVSLANIDPLVNTLRTAGYSSVGDGGAALYKRVASEPVHAGKVQSADGAWWELASGQFIHVEMFGAIPLTLSELLLRNGTGIASIASANDTAFESAADFMSVAGGGTFYGLGQFYVLSTGFRFPNAVYFEGSGHGKWMPSFPTEAKTWDGTNLLAYGDGLKNYTAPGITSAETSGGWRTDPDNPSRKFKLLSFMNRDASGTTPATPKNLAVFIANKTRHGDKGGLRRCRVCPWIGTDGISTYDSQSGSDLGADWDIGVLIDTMEGCLLEDVQVRGYWRMIGIGEISPDFDTWSRSEANVFRRTSGQGFVGMTIRSGQQHKILSSTATSVTIKWDAENIFPATGGQINLINAGYTTYTSTTRVGDNLTFNGLNKDPAGSLYLRNPYRGTGFSTGSFEDVEAWALWHHSGQSAEQLGFPSPSSGFQISGFPMRGLNFYNFSIFGENSTSPNIHMHNCFDANFIGGKLEIGMAIASPAEADQEDPTNAAGSTENLSLLGFYIASDVDTRLFKPRYFRDVVRQINPSTRRSQNLQIASLEGQNIQLIPATGGNVAVTNQAGQSRFIVYEGSGNASFGGHISPMADNAYGVGTGSLRWSVIYAGTGTINTSDAREKDWRGELSEAELNVAKRLSKLIGIYKWKDAITRKGEDARLHAGVQAQDVIAAFEAEGLDAFAYGVVCYDKWDASPEVTEPIYDADGNDTGETNIIEAPREAGDRYGIRYDELWAFVAAGLEERLQAIETSYS